jgi:hypothetical protein
MKFLIVNTDYPAFLDALYAARPTLVTESYAEQLRARNESLFGVSDFYPRRLQELGHEAVEVHINNRPLQRAWAAEQGLRLDDDERLKLSWRRGWVPWISRDQNRWVYDILSAQIEHYQPDVLLTHAVADVDREFWRRMRRCYKLLVGQVASPLGREIDLSEFDLMLSSLPNFVERFRAAGLRAELFRLAFDPSVLEQLGEPLPPIDVSFVGSLSPHHAERIDWLERVCAGCEVKVWGQGVDSLAAGSPIRKAYQGPAWGRDMYRILRASRIALNHHIGLSERYANNMRLYEATGVGTLLVTDSKVNLHEMFAPGREIVTYQNADECRDRIRYYLKHEDERAAIARAGQQRTHREHTYRQRMEQLVSMVGSNL